MAPTEDNSKPFGEKDFVHLHLHTDYSLLRSAIQIKALSARLSDLGQSACAITDFYNLYGAVTFYNVLKEKGIKPIIGYEAAFTFEHRGSVGASVMAGERPFYDLVLLAKDLTGYKNLVYLASKAFTEGSNTKPHIDLGLLSERSEGLIALSSGPKGAIHHYLTSGNHERADATAKQLIDIFGRDNFFIEIQDHGLPEEAALKSVLRSFSEKHKVGLVATNDCHYLEEEDARAHEVLMCIGEGKTLDDVSRPRFDGSQYYVKSAAEMWSVFGKDFPDALQNTVRIAEACNVVFPKDAGHHLPSYPIPPTSRCATKEAYFEEVVMEGFAQRKATLWDPMVAEGALRQPLEEYERRIRVEIDTIIKMGFPGYFLIVWDFIKYAKERGIPVGPGRGSAAGSLVAFCLNITDVDPIQHDLLFERFLNPERISMPDIDIDFCIRGRGDVITHVAELYGRESVCQIITFGTMASRAAIKDVGRALNIPYGDVEAIAKLIPPPIRGRNVSITKALEDVPELKRAVENDPRVKDLVTLALRLEGCSRHSSVHAAGVVISPQALHELVPVAISAKNELTSQYSMNDLEKVGMLKMDFLGLTTLTVINDCLSSLRERRGVEIDWSKVKDGDEKTMKLFADGRTDAIFQFESGGMQEITRKLKPRELEDLAALNALYRPGPLDGGMVDDFISRHRGDTPVEYIVPEMEDILRNTFGILVYQEQIMQIAQRLGGYTLGEADMMRRAMGKKKREEMAVHEEKFISGAVERGIKQDKARRIFDLMSQFADYGFNRSHSVAYAYVAYQTAYLKAHYPTYFYAAVLSHEANDSAKVYKYSNELRSSGLKLLPPDINESDEGFTPLEDSVRYGLTAIKGLGTSSVQAIIEARKGGRFTSLFDFAGRIPSTALNKKALESLICAGAFDSLKSEDVSLNLWRAKLHAAIEKVISHGQRAANDRARGQDSLFGTEHVAEDEALGQLPEATEWSPAELLQHEKDAVGFYLSSHPLDTYRTALHSWGIPAMSELSEASAGTRVRVAGIVTGAALKYSKKGNRYSIFRLEDQSGGVKCLAWSEACNKFSPMLVNDEKLLIDGRVESNDGTDLSIVIENVSRLADAIPRMSRRVEVTLPKNQNSPEFFEELLTLIGRERGECSVSLNLELETGIVVEVGSIPLGVQGSGAFEEALTSRGCKVIWRTHDNGSN